MIFILHLFLIYTCLFLSGLIIIVYSKFYITIWFLYRWLLLLLLLSKILLRKEIFILIISCHLSTLMLKEIINIIIFATHHIGIFIVIINNILWLYFLNSFLLIIQIIGYYRTVRPLLFMLLLSKWSLIIQLKVLCRLLSLNSLWTLIFFLTFKVLLYSKFILTYFRCMLFINH